MFQSFVATSAPDQGPPRLARLREEMSREGLAGFLVPRADAHQGEYVAPRDERLAWLTGFTGSAGFCAVLADRAGLFVDGRYRVQVKAQTAPSFTPVDWPEVRLGPWLAEALDAGRVGFDPWLHTIDQIAELERALAGSGITLVACDNLVDRIWEDQPGPPMGAVRAHDLAHAGEAAADKRARLAETLRAAGQKAAVITQPDSIAWLLNIRGSDIPRVPIAHGFALLHDDGGVDLFMDPEKLQGLDAHLGPEVRVAPRDDFAGALAALDGPVRVDTAGASYAVAQILDDAGIARVSGSDPCALPKARKNAAESAGARAAHLRDGAAMVRFLTWFDAQPPGTISEIDVARRLEQCRRETNALQDISFDTIAGSGPNGAIAHYRVTEDSNRVLQDGELLVLDSGGQYLDGTTDITRTLAIGDPGEDERAAFTRVLQGMIAVSRLRWPVGLAGRDLEAVGRVPLWQAGQDFDHGLGHGVGAYLGVHEGPQRLSRISHVPLEPGMILSNEPGYYREGAFGIRIENLVQVIKAPALPGGDDRPMLCFDTLTFVPIDRRLILADRLSRAERAWVDAYHAACREKLAPALGSDDNTWLDAATAPL